MNTVHHTATWDLVPIEGLGLATWASPGTERHARRVGARAAQAHAWLSELLGFRPRAEVCVLAPGDWGQVTDVPVFGFPHFVGGATVVVAGTPAPFFDGLFELVESGLDGPGRDRLQAVYGDPPHLDRFVELLVVHELAHLFHTQAGFWFPERWLSELFCNLALTGWVAEHEPEANEVLHTFPELAAAAIDLATLAVHTIDRMAEALEAGPAACVWYQQLLQVTAGSIWSRGGPATLRRLLDRFRDGRPYRDLRATLRDDVHPALAEVIDTWPA